MNSHNVLRTMSSLATALTIALATATCADQPKVRCSAMSADWIAKYEIVSPPSGTCDGVDLPVKGESIGIQTYVPSPADPDAANQVNSIALKATWIGERIASARDHATDEEHNPDLASQRATLANYPYGAATPPVPPPDGPPSAAFPYAFGKFETVYPEGEVCKVAAITPSDLTYPEIPEHEGPDWQGEWATVDAAPATAVKYAWSNVRVIVTPESIGTQAFADLTVTKDGCTASYRAALLAPNVWCGRDTDDGKTVADETLCNPLPTDKSPYGSGLGQGISTRCENLGDDENPLFACVPTKTAP